MEDAVVQRLGQEGAHQVVGQHAPIDARLVEGCGVRQGDTLGPVQGQDALADALPDHLGRRHIAIQGHHFAQFAGPGRLQAQVQFQFERAGDDAGQGGGFEPAGQGDRPFDQAASQFQHLDVLGDAPLDPRAQHLDRHGAAVGQGGRMGLGDGGGGDRLAEGDVEGLDRMAEVGRDDGPGLVGREGRQLVLQPAEILGEWAAEDVGAGREHLSQFYGGRAQVLQGVRQPLARPTLARLGTGEQAQGAGDAAPGRRQDVVDLARDQGVSPDQHPGRGDQASKGGRTAHAVGIAQPWCRAATPPVKLVQPTRPKPASFIIWAKRAWSGKRRMLSTRY